MHALGELTQRAEDAILQKDAEGLGQILSQAHLHLKEMVSVVLKQTLG